MKSNKTQRVDPELIQKKKRIRYLTVTSALAVVTVLSIILNSRIRALKASVGLDSVYEQAQSSVCSVIFPDSGSAGCALIHSGGHDILIDCGREKAQTDIADILTFINADTIDLAVLTHPDSDHIGNFAAVSDKFCISAFLTCEYSESSGSRQFSELRQTLDKNGVPVEFAFEGDVYNFGDVTLEVIAPVSEKVYKKSNDNSVVLRLRCGGFSALFPGDISSTAEKDILASGRDISADVLYVPHHGSKTSASEEFLRAVSPRYAVISVEEDKYHPADETITRLINAGCEIYRTDISGTAAVLYDGDDIEIAAAKRPPANTRAETFVRDH